MEPMGEVGNAADASAPPPGLDPAVWSGLKSLFIPVTSSLQQLHDKVSAIETNAVTKVELSQHLEPINTNLDTLNKTAASQSSRVEALENSVNKELPARLAELERLIQNIHIDKSKTSACTAVVGGLQSASSVSVAKGWMEASLKKAGVDGYGDIYHKGDDTNFNGMLFIKFESETLREDGMRKFNLMKTGLHDAKSYMSADLPVQERVPRSVLFQLKRMLIDWAFQKGSVYVNTDNGTLEVEGAGVAKVYATDYVLKVDWINPEWENWKELQTDTGFTALIADAQKKLEAAKKRVSKGKGKSSEETA